jgi:hypothetical protein
VVAVSLVNKYLIYKVKQKETEKNSTADSDVEHMSYVCMYVRMYVCMYVTGCMYARTYVGPNVCMYT